MKTIPLSEAFMKATKGPFTSDTGMVDVSDQAQMIVDNIGTDREWQAVGINDSEGVAEVVALCHPINAALIAHCFNHFQEVVAALEDCECKCRKHLDFPDVTIECVRCKALAKANQVEIPSS